LFRVAKGLITLQQKPIEGYGTSDLNCNWGFNLVLIWMTFDNRSDLDNRKGDACSIRNLCWKNSNHGTVSSMKFLGKPFSFEGNFSPYNIPTRNQAGERSWDSGTGNVFCLHFDVCVACCYHTVSRLVVPKSNNPRVLLCDRLDFPNWKTLRVHLTNIWEESFALDCHCGEYMYTQAQKSLCQVWWPSNIICVNYITLEPCIICRPTWCSGFLEVARPEFKVHIQQSRQGMDSLCPIDNNEKHWKAYCLKTGCVTVE